MHRRAAPALRATSPRVAVSNSRHGVSTSCGIELTGQRSRHVVVDRLTTNQGNWKSVKPIAAIALSAPQL